MLARRRLYFKEETTMPGMYVNTTKLAPETRDLLAEKLFAGTVPVFRGEKGPKIHTYFNEYETVYENGKPLVEKKDITINLEASTMPVDKIELLAEGLTAAVKEVLGEECGCTFVYHANGLDHIAVNGKLLKK
ncbi:MAG: hypothetical protein H6Q61_185 [Firmicutes bacterium]|nr:hypothetical protein [Bacillota bacterium]